MKLDLEIDENHSVVSRRVLLDGFDGTKMESCVNHALDRAKIARSHKTAPAYLIARIHFVLDSYIDILAKLRSAGVALNAVG